MGPFDIEIAKAIINTGAIGISLAAFAYAWLHVRDARKFHDDHEDRMTRLEDNAVKMSQQLEEIRQANHYAMEADRRIEAFLLKIDGRLDHVERRFERVLGKMGYPPIE